jgi:hypothetical protein
VTSLLPQLGTALGRVNPNFGPWATPAGLPEPVADQIRTLVPLLSNHLDGSNILAVASYTNFQAVNVQGIDVGINHSFLHGWQTAFTYSWFDFEIPDQAPGTADLFLPNTPTHGLSAGFPTMVPGSALELMLDGSMPSAGRTVFSSAMCPPARLWISRPMFRWDAARPSASTSRIFSTTGTGNPSVALCWADARS